MKKLTFSSNFGRFAYVLTALVAEDLDVAIANMIANEGLANLGFRAVGSNVEKALVAGKAMTKDDKRSVAEYSEANAEIVRAAAQAQLDKVCGDKETPYPAVSIAITGEHVFGETEASRKMATTLWESIQTEQDAAKQAGMLLGIGATSETSDEDGIELAHVFLGTLRAPRKSKKG